MEENVPAADMNISAYGTHLLKARLLVYCSERVTLIPVISVIESFRVNII